MALPEGPDVSRLRLAAAAGLACVLVVVVLSAAIRLNAAGIGVLFDASQLAALRGLHRSAASLEVLAALWLAWVAWRNGRAPWAPVAAVLALTGFLAVLGIATGRNPPPLPAMGNLLGGLALAAAFASAVPMSACGRSKWGSGKWGKWGLTLFLTPFLLLALQAVIGARLAVFGRTELPALPLHALLGLVVAALLGWLALARVRGRRGAVLFGLALAAPLAGFSALHYEYAASAALVHAASGAFLVAAAVLALRGNA